MVAAVAVVAVAATAISFIIRLRPRSAIAAFDGEHTGRQRQQRREQHQGWFHE
jgi:hypothetical protein